MTVLIIKVNILNYSLEPMERDREGEKREGGDSVQVLMVLPIQIKNSSKEQTRSPKGTRESVKV